MIRSALLLALGGALFAAAAAAQTAPAGDWSVTLGAASDNRSKDASKSDGDPFAYGQVQWTNPSEIFYAGAGAETIKSSGGSDLETQAFAGFRPEIAGYDVELKAAYKYQVDSNPGVDDDAWEFTGNLSRSIGPASGRLQVQYSPDGTGSTDAWTWVEARAGWAFSPKLKGTAAIGRREQDNSVDYTGWNAGLTYAFARKLDLDVRYYDTDAPVQTAQYEGALVVAVNAYF